MRTSLILFILTCYCGLFAQTLPSSLERKTIFIGEQNTLILDASQIETNLKWPNKISIFGIRLNNEKDQKDTIEIEVIQHITDSLKKNTLAIQFTIWDSGVVTLLPITLDSIDKQGQIQFDPQLVWVRFPDINPEGDILDIEEGKIILSEPNNWLWISLLIIAIWILLLLLIFIIIRIKNIRKKKNGEEKEHEIILTLRQQTEQQLQTLFEKQLWKNNQQKLHVVELTEILRIYIQKRYAIDALEKTTMEINVAMQMKNILREHIEALTTILKQADMVKFAKIKLNETEIEIINQQAFNYIELTEKKEDKSLEEKEA
jgi:hypothetical protein